MPHSPYQKTIYARIDDLKEYTQALAYHRSEMEAGVSDKYRDDTLLDLADDLAEHCGFLEGKLRVKVPKKKKEKKIKDEYCELAQDHNYWMGRVNALSEKVKAQENEINSLKSELEKIEEQNSANSGGENSAETGNVTEQSNPRKRNAETDPATDGEPVKRVKEDATASEP
ncbi:MAG: hypothetical protein Q9225_004820 [Loekoesia sp. 1 TL-2023]